MSRKGRDKGDRVQSGQQHSDELGGSTLGSRADAAGSEHGGNRDQAHRQDQVRKWWGAVFEIDRWVKVATVVGGFGTVGGLLLLSNSVDDARSTTEIENRAWVVADSLSLDIPEEEGKPLSASLGVKNVGNSPALELDMSVYGVLASRVVLDSSILPERWSQGDALLEGQHLRVFENISSAVLGSNQVMSGHVGQNIKPTQGQLNSLRSPTGDVVLLILAKATYTDVFRKRRTTYICRHWSGREIAGKGGVCKRWNSAD